MRRTAFFGRLVFSVMLVTGMMTAVATAALAGEEVEEPLTTVAIHKAECYTGVGEAIFDECYDRVLAGVDFTVGDFIGATDEFGNVAFIVEPGDVTMTEDPAVAAQYLGSYVYCAVKNVEPEFVLYNSDVQGGTFILPGVEEGDEVRCDWYNITPAPDDDDDDNGDDNGYPPVDDGDDATPSLPTTLPSTGSGFLGGNGASSAMTTVFLLMITLMVGAAYTVRRLSIR